MVKNKKWQKSTKISKKVLTLFSKKGIISLRFKQKPLKKGRNEKKVKKYKKIYWHKSRKMVYYLLHLRKNSREKRREFFENWAKRQFE